MLGGVRFSAVVEGARCAFSVASRHCASNHILVQIFAGGFAGPSLGGCHEKGVVEVNNLIFIGHGTSPVDIRPIFNYCLVQIAGAFRSWVRKLRGRPLQAGTAEDGRKYVLLRAYSNLLFSTLLGLTCLPPVSSKCGSKSYSVLRLRGSDAVKRICMVE
jgi:hypothetical protein